MNIRNLLLVLKACILPYLIFLNYDIYYRQDKLALSYNRDQPVEGEFMENCEEDIRDGSYVLELVYDIRRPSQSYMDSREFTQIPAGLFYKLGVGDTIREPRIENGSFVWAVSNETVYSSGNSEMVRDLDYFSFRINKIRPSLLGGYTIQLRASDRFGFLDADYFNTSKNGCFVFYHERNSSFVPRDNQEWCIRYLERRRSKASAAPLNKTFPVVEITCLKGGLKLGASWYGGVKLYTKSGDEGALLCDNAYQEMAGEPVFTKWLLIPRSEYVRWRRIPQIPENLGPAPWRN